MTGCSHLYSFDLRLLISCGSYLMVQTRTLPAWELGRFHNTGRPFPTPAVGEGGKRRPMTIRSLGLNRTTGLRTSSSSVSASRRLTR